MYKPNEFSKAFHRPCSSRPCCTWAQRTTV